MFKSDVSVSLEWVNVRRISFRRCTLEIFSGRLVSESGDVALYLNNREVRRVLAAEKRARFPKRPIDSE